MSDEVGYLTRRSPSILPLLDVVFILLFFMLFSLVVASGYGQLDVLLPRLGAGQAAEKGEQVLLRIGQDGTVAVGERVFQDLAVLEAHLREAKHERLTIAAYERIAYQRVMSVLAVVHATGTAKVSLLYEQASGQGAESGSSGDE